VPSKSLQKVVLAGVGGFVFAVRIVVLVHFMDPDFDPKKVLGPLRRAGASQSPDAGATVCSGRQVGTRPQHGWIVALDGAAECVQWESGADSSRCFLPTYSSGA
jgi:hypothetical protein